MGLVKVSGLVGPEMCGKEGHEGVKIRLGANIHLPLSPSILLPSTCVSIHSLMPRTPTEYPSVASRLGLKVEDK